MGKTISENNDEENQSGNPSCEWENGLELTFLQISLKFLSNLRFSDLRK